MCDRWAPISGEKPFTQRAQARAWLRGCPRAPRPACVLRVVCAAALPQFWRQIAPIVSVTYGEHAQHVGGGLSRSPWPRRCPQPQVQSWSRPPPTPTHHHKPPPAAPPRPLPGPTLAPISGAPILGPICPHRPSPLTSGPLALALARAPPPAARSLLCLPAALPHPHPPSSSMRRPASPSVQSPSFSRGGVCLGSCNGHARGVTDASTHAGSEGRSPARAVADSVLRVDERGAARVCVCVAGRWMQGNGNSAVGQPMPLEEGRGQPRAAPCPLLRAVASHAPAGLALSPSSCQEQGQWTWCACGDRQGTWVRAPPRHAPTAVGTPGQVARRAGGASGHCCGQGACRANSKQIHPPRPNTRGLRAPSALPSQGAALRVAPSTRAR